MFVWSLVSSPTIILSFSLFKVRHVLGWINHDIKHFFDLNYLVHMTSAITEVEKELRRKQKNIAPRKSEQEIITFVNVYWYLLLNPLHLNNKTSKSFSLQHFSLKRRCLEVIISYSKLAQNTKYLPFFSFLMYPSVMLLSSMLD